MFEILELNRTYEGYPTCGVDREVGNSGRETVEENGSNSTENVGNVFRHWEVQL